MRRGLITVEQVDNIICNFVAQKYIIIQESWSKVPAWLIMMHLKISENNLDLLLSIMEQSTVALNSLKFYDIACVAR